MVKRKEKNLTQAELAEKLGISNKTILKKEDYKWKNKQQVELT